MPLIMEGTPPLRGVPSILLFDVDVDVDVDFLLFSNRTTYGKSFQNRGAGSDAGIVRVYGRRPFRA